MCRLIENECVDFRGEFDVRDVFDQDAQTAAAERAATMAVGVARMNAQGQLKIRPNDVIQL